MSNKHIYQSYYKCEGFLSPQGRGRGPAKIMYPIVELDCIYIMVKTSNSAIDRCGRIKIAIGIC
jgi:hypothetical protein